MEITINSKYLTIRTGQSGQNAATSADASEKTEESQSQPVIPVPADVNVIPSPLTLSTHINSAVALSRSGIKLDRGTILNLLI